MIKVVFGGIKHWIYSRKDDELRGHELGMVARFSAARASLDPVLRQLLGLQLSDKDRLALTPDDDTPGW